MHGIDSPSKLSQYKKLLRRFNKGLLGAMNDDGDCIYKSGKQTCVVGALFNAAQLKDIQKRDLNNDRIGLVASDIGQKNIEAVTGFTIEELEQMQTMHDAAYSWSDTSNEFKQWLEMKILEESIEVEIKKLKENPPVLPVV
jgi:hypothetical protein